MIRVNLPSIVQLSSNQKGGLAAGEVTEVRVITTTRAISPQ